MRISMIGPFGFHPNKTMQSRAMGLARPLIQNGHTVTIFMPPWHTPEQADRRWEEDGVQLRYVPLGGGTLGITRRLVQDATAGQPDIIHCFKPKAYSGLAAWWLWQFNRQIPLVMDSDDWEGDGGWNDKADYSFAQKRFFNWQEQWGLRHNHLLTVASRELEKMTLEMGVPAQKVLYLPNGAGFPQVHQLESEAWREARTAVRQNLNLNDEPLLLLYSRLFEFDITRLIGVLRRVKTAVPTLRILSIGSGLFARDAAQLRQQFAEAKLLDSVIDAGWVEPAELARLFTAVDAGIYLMDDTLLNRTKCPVKLADMVRAAIPVVGEAVGQVTEYVADGRSGFTHRSGDVGQLSQSLRRLLQNNDLQKQMAQAAQQHAKSFAWSHTAQKLETAYERLLQQR